MYRRRRINENSSTDFSDAEALAAYPPARFQILDYFHVAENVFTQAADQFKPDKKSQSRDTLADCKQEARDFARRVF